MPLMKLQRIFPIFLCLLFFSLSTFRTASAEEFPPQMDLEPNMDFPDKLAQSINDRIHRLYKSFKEIQRDKFSILYHQSHTIKSSKIASTPHTYLVNKMTYLDHCIFSVAMRIIQKYQKNEIIEEREEGPVNLGTIELSDIEPFKYERNKNWGNGLTFKGVKNGRGTDLKVYFWHKRTGLALKRKFERLIPLCHEKREWIERHKPQLSQLPNEPVDFLQVPFRDKRGIRKIFARGEASWPDQDDDKNKSFEKARLLKTGEDSFFARLNLIRSAKKEMIIQTLNFFGDESGITLGEEMIKKAKEGVKITLIFDNISNLFYSRSINVWRNSYQLFYNMLASGIKVYGYRPPLPMTWTWDEIKLFFRYQGDVKILNDRIHEKIMIADNQHLIMGGMNIADLYLGINALGRSYWRDQDIEIEGTENQEKMNPIITDARLIFEGNEKTFHANFTDPEDSKAYNPYTPGTAEYEKHFKQHYDGHYHYNSIMPKEQKIVRYTKAHMKKLLKEYNEGTIPKTKSYDLIRTRLLQSRPKLKEKHIQDAYLHLIRNAKEEIIISNAYFIPEVEIIQALVAASKRGVKIIIMTNSPEANDGPVMSGLSRYIYKNLADHSFGKKNNLEIYEWTGQKSMQEEASIVYGTNHSKFMLVDKKAMLVGSYNIDSRSLIYNSESNVLLEQEELTKELRDYFFEHDMLYAIKIDYAQMVEWHLVPGLISTFYLKSRGFFPDRGILELIRYKFFFDIARLSEDTW